MADLIFLAGLLLSQALSVSDTSTTAHPAGVLDIHGQTHVLKFEGQSLGEAIYSVEAALMMHARDASRYGVVKPDQQGNSGPGFHFLQVSERGSVGDLAIRFSIQATGKQISFETFEVSVHGKRLEPQHYAQLRSELERGYQSQSVTGLPDLPASQLSMANMI